jgi:hypothetical protein
MQLSSLYVAKVMVIPDFFKEFLRIFIQEISDGELQYAQNDIKCSSLACM